MEAPMKLGLNKTGIDMSPIHTKEMLEGIESMSVIEGKLVDNTDYSTNGKVLAGEQTLKKTYLEEAGPLGSVPMPATAKGVAKSLLKKATGHRPEVFINKLGERLAYERSGVRVYDALIAKCEATITSGMPEQKIDLEMIKTFRNEEAQHFELLTNTIRALGGDPTSQTPDADATGVAASGIMKVITDPRTSVCQCLEAMLALELADNDAWDLLIKLADDMGLSDIAEKFRHALAEEDVHLLNIRQWHEELVRSQAALLG